MPLELKRQGRAQVWRRATESTREALRVNETFRKSSLSEWEDYQSRTLWGRGKKKYDLGTERWKAECGREIREAGAALSDAFEAMDLTNKVKHNFLYLKPCHCVWWWGHYWPFERCLPRAAWWTWAGSRFWGGRGGIGRVGNDCPSSLV